MARRSETAVWLAVLGIVSVLAGGRWVLAWEQLGPALRAYAAVMVGGGILAVLAAIVLGIAGGGRPARWAGAAAAAASGVALLAGTASGTIPCAGPG